MQVRVTRASREAPSWETAAVVIPNPLRPYIRRISGYAEPGGGMTRRREPVYPGLPLIIGTGPTAIESAGSTDSYRAFVAGLFDHHVFSASRGGNRGIQIDLTPAGALAVLRISVAQLHNRLAPIDGFWPDVSRRAQEQLAAGESWERVLTTCLAELSRRIKGGPQLHPLVERAWRSLELHHGQIKIERLAERVGSSRAHLARAFRRDLGITIKEASRFMRFERAAQATARSSQSLAGVAAHHGYADQAHLTREFGRLAGCTPAVFRSEAGADRLGAGMWDSRAE